MSEPTISVLLPVYNAAPYLSEAVESVLAQSFEDFEFLALDDGSTDGSLNILREYETRDRRLRVISRQNKGLIVSLNELISQARGRYLARMDGDDVCAPLRFQKQLEFLDARSDYIVVGGWISRINQRGLPIGVLQGPCEHEEIDRANLKGHTSIHHPTAMIRKSAVLAVGGYREEYCHAEDLDLWLRMAEIGKLANLPEVVLRYRLHANSICQSNHEEQRSSMERACVSAWQRRGKSEQFEVSEHWRPSEDNSSLHKFAVQYGWIAWGQGNNSTWRAYAWESLRLRPFSIESWKLLIFGLFTKPAH